VLPLEPAFIHGDPGLLVSYRKRIEPLRGDFWFAVRVLAFCFGACVLVNVVGALRHPWFDANIWWLDLRLLPPWGRLLLPAATGAVLIGSAARPMMSDRRRMVSRAVAGTAAAVAFVDTIRFYVLWNDGTIAAKSPVPVSIVVSAAMLLFAASTREPRPAPRSSRVALGAAVTLAFLVGVPLMQITAFGTTDYRRPADAIVVFGARVRADGIASIVLAERVVRASELYRAGLADTVVMTGGIEPTGFDETVVMRDLAVSLGVPARAILLDPTGINTLASVEGTAEILRGRGLSTVLAVSQPYHLPRIKLAYARSGLDVWTVPAKATIVPRTGAIVAREIPAFWLYYLRATFT
jgi:uncharacterized SAM-binding protein YcdF (DUF218 family)